MIQEGTKVNFRNKQGLIKGTVISTYPQITYQPYVNQEMARVVDFERGRCWVIDISSLSEQGSVTYEGLKKARELSQAITTNAIATRRKNVAAREKVTNRNMVTARKNELLNLGIGHQIEVKYRGNRWIRRTFLGYTPAGKMKIQEDGRIRFVKPKNVRNCP